MGAHGGKELGQLSVGRFFNVTWWLITRDRTEASVDSLRARLWIPPAGEDVPDESPWSAKSENQAFASLKAGTSG